MGGWDGESGEDDDAAMVLPADWGEIGAVMENVGQEEEEGRDVWVVVREIRMSELIGSSCSVFNYVAVSTTTADLAKATRCEFSWQKPVFFFSGFEPMTVSCEPSHDKNN